MPKTRQQRLAEERAGHPQSPPQFLEDKPRGPKRTRAKTPGATVAAGPVVPAAQSAVLGEPQALLYVWVDAAPEASGRLVGDPTHQMTIPSSVVPELITFVENLCNQEQNEMTEAILPKQPEPTKQKTANKLSNGEKSAFRRNPLLATSTLFKSQLVEASLDTSAADGITTLQADTRSIQKETLIPETPQGSSWSIGNLIPSARSIKKRFGFRPLALDSESPDSFPQTPTPSASTAQTFTEVTAPIEPKKKATSPTSAKDARAKKLRQYGSVLKPVKKPIAGSNSHENESSWAEKDSPASGVTDEAGAEEDQFPATRPTDGIKAETRQAEIGEQTAEPTIRWPSRWLDRMNQNKRKRWGEPVAMASTKCGSNGPDETDLYGDSDQQPGKIRRTRESQGFSSRVAGDPYIAQPYSPPNLQQPARRYQGGNIFAENEAANASQQSLPKTPIPTTNPSGTFKVPSPGDDDWSDSGSEEEEGNTAGLDDITPSRARNEEFASPNTSLPPPMLPKPQQVSLSIQVEALQKARAKFLKHKPRIPSRLSQSTRAYPSPPVPANRRQSGPESVATSNPLQAGGANFTAFEEWSKTASLAVTSAIENMEVDSILAGQAFMSGLENFTSTK
ncbi:hypothetical protein MMC31_002473 [Peltigera leucophlebia]|nr:hypothetical protein [Peltigera leucophlebia]